MRSFGDLIKNIEVKVIGKGGHGSDPKLSNNPIIPSLEIYTRYLSLVEKY